MFTWTKSNKCEWHPLESAYRNYEIWSYENNNSKNTSLKEFLKTIKCFVV